MSAPPVAPAPASTGPAAGPKEVSARMKFIEKHRAKLVCACVLPQSCVLSLSEKFKRWRTRPSAGKHADRVQRVCGYVKRWGELKNPPPMVTDRNVAFSHSVRMVDKTKFSRIPIGELRAILGVAEVDGATVVKVEPGVTVGEVSKYLLKRGLQLECTLEMEEATLGGLAAATGMTTHSHACGLIHDTIVEWEVVTAAGEAIAATAGNDHCDLFKALPWSHGSLGFIVGLTLRCVKSQPFVRLTYTPHTSLASFHAAYEAALADPDKAFYVEGIIFSPETAVLMEGTLVSKIARDAPLNAVGRWYKRWFYTHVRSVLEGNGSPRVETVPMYV